MIKVTSVISWPRASQITNLTSSQQVLLQLIALLSMTIGHYLLIFDDGDHWFRSISRFVYPAFAYLVTYNYLYRARNKVSYMTRLLVWACISQPIYSWALEIDIFKLNILFTLFLGLAFIYIHDLMKQKLQAQAELTMLVYASLFIFFLVIGIFVSYYWFGLTLLAAFVLYFRSPSVLHLLIVAINIVLLNILITGLDQGLYGLFFFTVMVVVTKLAEGIKINRPPSLLLYVYYPLHLLILGIIHIMV